MSAPMEVVAWLPDGREVGVYAEHGRCPTTGWPTTLASALDEQGDVLVEHVLGGHLDEPQVTAALLVALGDTNA